MSPPRLVVTGTDAMTAAIASRLQLFPQEEARHISDASGPGGNIEGIKLGGSHNHQAMQSVAWGLTHEDWRYYNALATAMLSDPRIGIGSKQCLSPVYDSWSRVPDIAALAYGPELTRRLARTVLRAWAVVARFGLFDSSSNRKHKLISGNERYTWTPSREDLPFLASSAATRGLVGRGPAWWYHQCTVGIAEFVIHKKKINPTVVHLAEPDPRKPTPLWHLWAINHERFPTVNVVSEQEAAGWDRWKSDTLLNLAGRVPFGDGIFYCAHRKNAKMTWLSRDVHGTKPSVMIEKTTKRRSLMVSTCHYGSNGHTRSTTSFINTPIGVTVKSTGDTSKRVSMAKPKRIYRWSQLLEVI